jgi:hypothetical protein
MNHEDRNFFKNIDPWIDRSLPHIFIVSVIVGCSKLIEINAGNLFRLSDYSSTTDLVRSLSLGYQRPTDFSKYVE